MVQPRNKDGQGPDILLYLTIAHTNVSITHTLLQRFVLKIYKGLCSQLNHLRHTMRKIVYKQSDLIQVPL